MNTIVYCILGFLGGFFLTSIFISIFQNIQYRHKAQEHYLKLIIIEDLIKKGYTVEEIFDAFDYKSGVIIEKSE